MVQHPQAPGHKNKDNRKYVLVCAYGGEVRYQPGYFVCEPCLLAGVLPASKVMGGKFYSAIDILAGRRRFDMSRFGSRPTGHDPEGCHDCIYKQFGGNTDLIPGWDRRGVRPHLVGSKLKLAKFEDSDPPQDMADFYLLEYVIHATQGASYRTRRKQYALHKAAVKAQDAIVERLDTVFRDYGIEALAGEASYHRNVQTPIWILDWVKGAIGEGIMSRAEFAHDVMELFDDPKMWPTKTAFGGLKWGQCARTLWKRETGQLTPKLFVDQTFSLQHNGGSYLNKVNWGYFNEASADVYSMIKIGNAHHANPTMFNYLLNIASRPVRRLYELLLSVPGLIKWDTMPISESEVAEALARNFGSRRPAPVWKRNAMMAALAEQRNPRREVIESIRQGIETHPHPHTARDPWGGDQTCAVCGYEPQMDTQHESDEPRCGYMRDDNEYMDDY
jgi:hypothetical protein